jgi:hypothetical protein
VSLRAAISRSAQIGFDQISRHDMRAWNLAVAVVCIVLVFQAQGAIAQESPDRIEAAAWAGCESAELGQFYDVNFRPLRTSILSEAPCVRGVVAS